MMEPCFRKSVVFSTGLVDEAIAHQVSQASENLYTLLYIARRVTERFSDDIMGHNAAVSKSRFAFCCLD